jgi:hypothetical protein
LTFPRAEIKVSKGEDFETEIMTEVKDKGQSAGFVQMRDNIIPKITKHNKIIFFQAFLYTTSNDP